MMVKLMNNNTTTIRNKNRTVNFRVLPKVSNSVKKVGKYAINLFFLLILMITLLVGDIEINKQIFSWSILILSIYLVIKAKENMGLFIVYSLIAFFNYSIVITNYIRILSWSYFTSFSNDYVSYLGVLILFIFTLLLSLLMPNKITKTYMTENNFINKNSKNIWISTSFLIMILLYILIFQFGRPDTDGLRGSPSALYEYSIIFFIIGFHFVGINRKSNIILTILLALFALQNFAFGGRIIGIQLLFVYFIMFYSHKIKVVKLVPFIIAGFIIMSLIGIERASLTFSIQGINEVISNIKNRMFALDTSYSAYFTSLTFLKTQEYLNYFDRLSLFGKFLLSIIFGGSIQNSSLPLYTRTYFTHYNGGVFPYYFYFYLSWAGVVISTLLIRLYTSIINQKELVKSGLFRCISVYFIATTFRWYLYTPIIILRGTLLLIIVYYGFSFINKLKK